MFIYYERYFIRFKIDFFGFGILVPMLVVCIRTSMSCERCEIVSLQYLDIYYSFVHPIFINKIPYQIIYF
jgi:hypothetical protein